MSGTQVKTTSYAKKPENMTYNQKKKINIIKTEIAEKKVLIDKDPIIPFNEILNKGSL